MEQRELVQALQELIIAQTPEEKIKVLQRHPGLLNKENIDQLRKIAMMARLSLGEQVASALEKDAEQLANMAEKTSRVSKITDSAFQPSVVPWARLTREHLAFRKIEQLEQAIVSAEQAGENEIASLLRAKQENNIKIIEEHAHDLHRKLLSVGRSEEAWTVALLHLDMRALLAEDFIQFPLEQQAQVLETGIQACQQAADIANVMGDQVCKAHYLGMAGNGYYRGRHLEAAKSAYQEALKLYRKLANEKPDVYEPVAGTLNNIGNVQRDLRHLEAAKSAYQEALKLYRRLANEKPDVYEPYVAMMLNNLGTVQRDLRHLEAAKSAYQEALKLYRRLANEKPDVYEPYVAMMLNNLGTVQRDLRHLEAAKSAYQDALTIYRKLAKKQPDVYESYVAMMLNNLGTVLSDLHYLDAAESAYHNALTLYRKLVKEQLDVYEPDTAITLNNLGNVQRDLHHLETAASIYQDALTIYRKLAKKRPDVYEPDVANTLYNLGNVLKDMPNFKAAESAYQDALTIYRKLANEKPDVYEPDVAGMLNNLGNVQRNLRCFEVAESAYQEALAIRRKLAKKQPDIYEPDVAGTLNNIGNVQTDLRHLEAAKSAYQDALTIYRKLANEKPDVYEPDVAGTLNDLGTVLRGLRRLEAAESAHQEALTIRRKLAKKQPDVYEPGVARTLNNLGAVLSDLRRFKAAETAYQNALTLYRKLALDKPDVYESDIATTLNNLGVVLRDLYRFKAAETAYQKALTIRWKLAKKQPDAYEPYVAGTLNNIGNVQRDMHRFKAAETAYQKALALFRKLAKKQQDVYEPDVAGTLNNIGNVQRDLRRFKAAESAYQEALKLYRRHDIPDRMAVALSGLSLLWMESERWEESARLLEEAKEKMERLRVETLSLDRRMQIFRENIHVYENLLVCLMKIGRREDALVVAEAGRSRTLVDLLNLRDVIPRNVPGELADDYNRMLIWARALEYQIQSGIKTSRKELVKTHSRLQELVEEISKHNPDFLPYAQPLSQQEIRKLAEEARSTLILFRVTLQGSFVFLVFPDGKIDSIEVPEFTAKTLTDLLVKFKGRKAADGWLVRYYDYRHATGTKQKEARKVWLDTMDTTLSGLYEQLLKRVHQRIKGKTASLVIVSNRGLAILPLHACWWIENGTRHYLLDEFVIRYAPSLSIFKRCLERERCSPEMLLGVANPDPPGNLVFSEWECKEIERMLGNEQCTILWKNQATKKEVMKRASTRSWQWLHFSCHGQYRLDAPLESAIYFAGGEALTLGEIFESMYLPQAWLVILSACETGLVDFRDIADEHYGLPVGFLYAGAATVYSSLWMVNDQSTALLMRRVYEVLKEAKNKPDALCKAQSLNKAQCWLRDVKAGELAKILAQEERELGRIE